MSELFNGHNCITCSAKGGCSLQPIVTYIDSNPELGEVMQEDIKALMDSEWQPLFLADASLFAKGAKAHPVEVLTILALASGYLLGRGVKFSDLSINHERMFRAIIESARQANEQ